MTSQHKKNTSQSAPIDVLLWTAAGVLAVALLFSRLVWSEYTWLSVATGLLFVAALGGIVKRNFTALRSRQAAYGFNSAVTIALVVAIVGVINFLAVKYPHKLDLTKNKLNTLNDQTIKVVKGLQKPVKAILFVKAVEKERFRPLMENYSALSTKFEVEYVDPDREPTRAKTAGIKKYGTLQLILGAKDTKIEDATEEKLTNALIKLTKDKSPTLCAVVGHGEKNFSATDADGYATVKKGLLEQAYEVRDFQLILDAKDGKIPSGTCDALAIVGPTKSYLDQEIKVLKQYLDDGGRAIFALDINVKGGDYAPELFSLLQSWSVKVDWGIVVDPISRAMGVDPVVPIIATYSRDHAITRDFQPNCLFPFVRPVSVIPPSHGELKATWIAQTTPQSWAVTDSKQLTTGQVKLTEGKDRKGPLSVAVAVEGKQKDSKATRSTRIVVIGTSHLASNQYQKAGGNLDFFLNAVTWTLEDESLISIRARDEENSKVELSQKAGTSIFIVTVVLLPLLIATMGVVNWVRRRKL